MTHELIPAATILLLRDQPDLNVLMIERHANIKFAGGALVFPGGKIESSDEDRGWGEFIDGEFPEEQVAPRVAAIREAFEETGILLARRQGEGKFVCDMQIQHLSEWRKAIEDDDHVFLDLIRRENLILACDALVLFARWMPPEGVTHRRYFTWFFAARTPVDQIAREDGNEATDTVWVQPSSMLNNPTLETRRMIFPTQRNVELLSISKDAESVLNFAKIRKIETIQPKLIERDGIKYITIPEGLGYPITEESLEKAIRK